MPQEAKQEVSLDAVYNSIKAKAGQGDPDAVKFANGFAESWKGTGKPSKEEMVNAYLDTNPAADATYSVSGLNRIAKGAANKQPEKPAKQADPTAPPEPSGQGIPWKRPILEPLRQPLESAVGALARKMPKTPVIPGYQEDMKSGTSKPVAWLRHVLGGTPSQETPEQKGGRVAKAAGNDEFSKGFLEGAAGIGIDLTSPMNLGLAAANYFIPSKLAKKAPALVKIAKSVISGTFTAGMLQDISKEFPEIKKSIDAGNPEEAGKHAARALSEAVMSVGGVKRSAGQLREAVPADGGVVSRAGKAAGAFLKEEGRTTKSPAPPAPAGAVGAAPIAEATPAPVTTVPEKPAAAQAPVQTEAPKLAAPQIPASTPAPPAQELPNPAIPVKPEIPKVSYEDAVKFVKGKGSAEVKDIQRQFRVGYGTAAQLLVRMQREGVVDPANNGKWTVAKPASPVQAKPAAPPEAPTASGQAPEAKVAAPIAPPAAAGVVSPVATWEALPKNRQLSMAKEIAEGLQIDGVTPQEMIQSIESISKSGGKLIPELVDSGMEESRAREIVSRYLQTEPAKAEPAKPAAKPKAAPKPKPEVDSKPKPVRPPVAAGAPEPKPAASAVDKPVTDNPEPDPLRYRPKSNAGRTDLDRVDFDKHAGQAMELAKSTHGGEPWEEATIRVIAKDSNKVLDTVQVPGDQISSDYLWDLLVKHPDSSVLYIKNTSNPSAKGVKYIYTQPAVPKATGAQ